MRTLTCVATTPWRNQRPPRPIGRPAASNCQWLGLRSFGRVTLTAMTGKALTLNPRQTTAWISSVELQIVNTTINCPLALPLPTVQEHGDVNPETSSVVVCSLPMSFGAIAGPLIWAGAQGAGIIASIAHVSSPTAPCAVRARCGARRRRFADRCGPSSVTTAPRDQAPRPGG